ncbi:hypothetical protein [Longimicrobium sp.]|uniref:hypothetical protein n=1 Tax=Longimicrobium sp. TaxID=2029185 RepID=UPI002E319A26|nr:hypothetical protein [Longimicrobium sp.]HEX6037581.1 hypothetical protein [Longimicrobium sp.]
MDTPSVYIETSIVSYLAADPSRHPVTLRNQQLTHAWWATRERYTLYTSNAVVGEARDGDSRMAAARLALLDPITILAENAEVQALASALRHGIPLPARAHADAAHVAIAAVYGLAYLLTWNCKHIANPKLIPRIARICSAWGRNAPVLCTPAQLLED